MLSKQTEELFRRWCTGWVNFDVFLDEIINNFFVISQANKILTGNKKRYWIWFHIIGFYWNVEICPPCTHHSFYLCNVYSLIQDLDLDWSINITWLVNQQNLKSGIFGPPCTSQYIVLFKFFFQIRVYIIN